jgi:hypothetical protein
VAIKYYTILNSYKLVAITLATMYRIAACGKTHHDVLMAWMLGVSYQLVEFLRVKMEEVL